ncbi:MAG: hypothetical protein LWW93_04090 [Hyphomicrobiales bacterium]|nr:hypothetical protein [Hyphomicrobiales bacterium]
MSVTSSASLTAGSIRIAVLVEPGSDAPREIRLASTRPTGFSDRLFAGRSPAEVPGLAARLHALCGRSHMVASEIAIVAAMGRDVEPVIEERFEGLVAERLGEHLRSTVTSGWGRSTPVDREMLADVRAVLAACHTLVGGRDPQRGFEAAKAIEGIATALARLGLGIDRKGRLKTGRGGWADGLLAALGTVSGDRFAEADRLTGEDDSAVVAALARDPDGFAARPQLDGRHPETGPAARAGSGIVPTDGRGRLSARLAEIAEAAELLAAPAADRARLRGAWASGARVGPSTGWAAVESPRGRLHHLVRLEESGRVASYAILAPTEWNFHAAGPLARTLMLNRFPPGGEGRLRVERIAGLYDPCVGWESSIEDAADA